MPKPRGLAHRARGISLQELSAHFHLPINDVAQKLGVCVTVLKQRCREHNIARWPYRKVRKLDSIINSLQSSCLQEAPVPAEAAAAGTLDDNERKRKLETVMETRDYLLMNPNSAAHLKLGKSKSVSTKKGLDIAQTYATSFSTPPSPFYQPYGKKSGARQNAMSASAGTSSTASANESAVTDSSGSGSSGLLSPSSPSGDPSPRAPPAVSNWLESNAPYEEDPMPQARDFLRLMDVQVPVGKPLVPHRSFPQNLAGNDYLTTDSTSGGFQSAQTGGESMGSFQNQISPTSPVIGCSHRSAFRPLPRHPSVQPSIVVQAASSVPPGSWSCEPSWGRKKPKPCSGQRYSPGSVKKHVALEEVDGNTGAGRWGPPCGRPPLEMPLDDADVAAADTPLLSLLPPARQSQCLLQHQEGNPSPHRSPQRSSDWHCASEIVEGHGSLRSAPSSPSVNTSSLPQAMLAGEASHLMHLAGFSCQMVPPGSFATPGAPGMFYIGHPEAFQASGPLPPRGWPISLNFMQWVCNNSTASSESDGAAAPMVMVGPALYPPYAQMAQLYSVSQPLRAGSSSQGHSPAPGSS